ncbi:hypothetical protein NDU88_001057 [Pleurodeles waltl]|uniref:Uncharacterized protein n=1 Tax=Pleurodeles waltl TaxID=8319 RepID=A0AAV7KV59_PLEWA|nr:hypothetical protein NDU88_001057 [Pleurodeles waltl]
MDSVVASLQVAIRSVQVTKRCCSHLPSLAQAPPFSPSQRWQLRYRLLPTSGRGGALPNNCRPERPGDFCCDPCILRDSLHFNVDQNLGLVSNGTKPSLMRSLQRDTTISLNYCKGSKKSLT